MENWGTSFWRCIHYMSLHDKRDFLYKISDYIPCEKCKKDWVDASEDEDLVEWSIKQHNKVNKKLGKWDKWDIIDFNISHKSTCDVCEKREDVHGFPWTFLYTLSKTVVNENTNITQSREGFIKEFVAEYPCNVCRNKFIIDIPGYDETCTDWVYRNHIRFNKERGLTEPPNIQVNTENDSDINETNRNCEGCPDSSL
jgi:hypothetical protein